MIGKTCSGTQSGIDGGTQHPLATGPNPSMLFHQTNKITSIEIRKFIFKKERFESFIEVLFL